MMDTDYQELIDELQSDKKALEAENKRLRAVLEPFANAYAYAVGGWTDFENVFIYAADDGDEYLSVALAIEGEHYTPLTGAHFIAARAELERIAASQQSSEGVDDE